MAVLDPHMKEPFQLGDLIVRKEFNPTIPITFGKPYEVVDVERGERVYIIDNDGKRYPIARIFFHDRWVLFGANNAALLHLLKED